MHFLSEAATTAVGEVAEAGEDELDLGPNRILRAQTSHEIDWKLLLLWRVQLVVVLLLHMFTTIGYFPSLDNLIKV